MFISGERLWDGLVWEGYSNVRFSVLMTSPQSLVESRRILCATRSLIAVECLRNQLPRASDLSHFQVDELVNLDL